jgi:pimeloyl-ACP methyl ester carboxylesterase
MSFNIYSAGPPPSPTVPVVMCLHGGGYTGLTWAIVASRLKPHCRVIAPDLRGHGLTTTTTTTTTHTTYDTTTTNNSNMDSDLSLDTLASDVVAIWKSLFLASSTSPPPRTILLGHSMGGAVAVKAASLLSTIKPSTTPPPPPVSSLSSSPMVGVMVVDVVEGTALASLPHMKAVLSNRPSTFDSLEEAVGWALGSGTSRNPEAARVSIPSMLVAAVDVDSGEGEKGGEMGERSSMDGGDGVGRNGSFHRRATLAVPMTVAGNKLKDATLALQSVTEEEEEGEGGEEGDGGVEKQVSVGDKPMKRRATPMVSVSYLTTDKAKNDNNSGILDSMNEISIIAEDEEEEEGEGEGEGGRETGEEEHLQQEEQDQDSKDTEQHPPPAATRPQQQQQQETKRPPPPPPSSSMVLPSPFEFARSLVIASEKVKDAFARTMNLPVEYGRSGCTATTTTTASNGSSGSGAVSSPPSSANESMPTAITTTTTTASVQPPPNNNIYYVWKTDLSSSQPYWEGWYSGLSDSFLNLPLPKVLILAGADRLDKTLTVGQMQGKFQLVLAPQSGHAVQEDEPDKVAETVVQFCQRFKLIEDKGGEGRGVVVLPQVAGPLHVN